ncbi:MAG TPA: hypothetical protein VHK67_02225 [Rhabdochlamydiaceae bacterium]|jgi:hypothetical protein|nr:hypothetical protein [Rhabdochlamydiaceae bacterium]
MIDDIIISAEDLQRLYQKKKKKIWKFSSLGTLLLLIYFLFSPPLYQATATFKQSSSRSESGIDLKKLVRNFASAGSEISTIPVMLSRTVLAKTVEELGFQATVNEQNFLEKKLLACKSSLLAEFGKQPKSEENFHFQNVHYDGEKTRSYFLRFTSPEDFELLDRNQEKVVAGSINCPLQMQDIVFTLTKTPKSLKVGKFYPFSISPLYAVVARVKNQTRIKPLREDKNILMITFSDPDRERSAQFVNTLISKYEAFLVDENKSVIGCQLKYLDQRQNELNSKLDRDIQDHVKALKQSLFNQGYLGIEEEIESILSPLQTYQARLNEIEIEMAGLEQLEQRISEPDLPIAVHRSPPKLVRQFGQNLADQINDASLLLQKLEKDEPLTPTLTAMGPLITEVELSRSKPDYVVKKQQLASHLHSFLDHLALRQKNLQENSSYIDQLESDFNGLTLEASRNLFQQYCKQLDDLHAQLKQVIFFRDHLNEPNFEISTLSNILNDTVTQQLVQKSSELVGQLCDLINRSGREHERLKETLVIQKRYLESHLSQTLELGKIRIQLIKEKIGSLYQIMKDLLQKEKKVLESKIETLKISMQELPELWHLDKRLKFKAELTKGMMEGLTHIAESKNLSRHLYQVESKPLDLALPPFSPQPSHLLIKVAAGAFVLATLSYLFFLLQALLKGLPASLTTLRLMGGHTSGSFSSQAHLPLNQVPDQDLETLRSMTAFLLDRKNGPCVVGLLGKKESHFCFNLAHLLSLHHQKVLIIDGNFDRSALAQDQPGLWQYINHTASELPIRREKTYDLLTSGGTTRHGVELLASPIFSKILAECQSRYDFVFLLRQTPLSSQDAAQILQLSHLAIVATDEESQAVFKPYLQRPRQKENLCVTFTQYQS